MEYPGTGGHFDATFEGKDKILKDHMLIDQPVIEIALAKRIGTARIVKVIRVR